MAQQQAPDDIFALYCRFDLDVSQYHVFERETAESGKANATAAPAQVAEPLPAVLEVATSERQSDTAFIERRSDAQSEKVKERAGLRNLLTNLRHLHDRSVSTTADPACEAITILGSSGGVGVTTVMATLARQLSTQGLRCGLYDEAAEAILPLFFGFHRPIATSSRFAGLHSVLDASIRLLGPESLPLHSGLQSGELSVRDRLFETFAHELDYFITDEARSAQEAAPGTVVFVALPDLASLMNIRNLVDKTGWRCKNEETICVLNRFDPEFALHQELLTWYEEQFTQVITIRQSHLVPESLAEGTSVMDLAPKSHVASDFARLAACVRQTSARAGTNCKKLRAMQTQANGVAVCS